MASNTVFDQILPIAGTAIGSFFGGPIGGAVGSQAGRSLAGVINPPTGTTSGQQLGNTFSQGLSQGMAPLNMLSSLFGGLGGGGAPQGGGLPAFGGGMPTLGAGPQMTAPGGFNASVGAPNLANPWGSGGAMGAGLTGLGSLTGSDMQQLAQYLMMLRLMGMQSGSSLFDPLTGTTGGSGQPPLSAVPSGSLSPDRGGGGEAR